MSQFNHVQGSQDEEEIFLQEILSELRGENKDGMETKNVKELFQLTLEWLKTIKDDHNDLTKKIDEMKKALNKDIDKNAAVLLENNKKSSTSSNYGQESNSGNNCLKIKLMHSLKSISEEEN